MTTHLVTKWKLCDLHEHPQQQLLFGDSPDYQFNELVADLETNGQMHPVEITSTGRIIDGHQRVRALKKLGRLEIDVIVRSDLETLGDKAVEMQMIGANLYRRQLDIYGAARVYERLRELQPRRTRSPSGVIAQTARDRLAAQLGTKSGRTIERYLRLRKAPKAVQDAVSARKIGMTVALKVVGLPKAVQQRIETEILAGKSPNAVIARHVPKKGTKADDAVKLYKGLLRQLELSLGVLDVTVAKIVGKGLSSQLSIDVLGKSIPLLKRLLSAEQKLMGQRQKGRKDPVAQVTGIKPVKKA